MIAAIITDYERAVLDALREDKRLRAVLEPLTSLPETAEGRARTLEVYDNERRRRTGLDIIPEKTAARELANHETWQKEYRQYYKAKGYTPPYEYGTGRVKVLMRLAEDGEQEEQAAAGAEGNIVPFTGGKRGRKA